MTTHRRIPITTPARTIIDLARTLRGRPLEQLLDLADQRGLVDFDDLRSANPVARKASTNRIVEGIEVDFVWRDLRLVVEVDGYAHHRSPSAFELDRERDVTLTTRGWRVLRFTWAQINWRAGWVAASILAAWP